MIRGSESEKQIYMAKWTNMRTEVFYLCQKLYGNLTPKTHPQYIKLMKQMESLWKKDISAYNTKLNSFKEDLSGEELKSKFEKLFNDKEV